MNFITIENKGGKIRLNEQVTPDSIGRMIEEVGKLFGASAVYAGADFGPLMACAENAVDTLEIEVNSPGGSVFDGYTMFREIQSLRDRGVVVTATITGMAASMASVICMACDEIRMVPHGRMMIHDASNGTYGNAEAMRKMADLLDGISGDIAAIYANRTGKDVDAIRAMMKKETWMNAKDSKSLRFIDEILTGDSAKNAVDIAPAGNSPLAMSFLDRLTSPSDTEAKERIVALELQISQHDQSVSDLQAKLEIAETALQEASGLSVANATLTATVTTHEATIAENVIAIAGLTEKVTARETDLGLAAAKLLAAQGHGTPLVLGTGNVTEGDDKALTRDQFNALTPANRLAFAKAGGKIS